MRVSRSPGPPLIISIVVLVAGFVTAVTGGIGAAVSVARDIGTINGLPAVVERHLRPGAYDVYQAAPTTLTASDVSVTGPDGEDIPALRAQPSTIDFGEKYVAVVKFIANSSGDYTVVIRSTAAQGGDVLIARSDGNLFHAPAAWLSVLGAGGLVSVIGLILLIVGITRRDRATRMSRLAVASPSGPILVPPGWYPDPGGTAHYRWWDGAKWTEHTA
jgi:hypothetical protein